MWTELFEDSPFEDFRKLSETQQGQWDMEDCFQKYGVTRPIAILADMKARQDFFKYRKDYHLYYYDDGELHLVMDFKYIIPEECFYMGVMSDTMSSIDQLRRVVKIGCDKLKKFLKEHNQTKVILGQDWGEEDDMTGEGRKKPYSARLFLAFRRVFFDLIRENGFKILEDDENFRDFICLP